MPIYYMDAAVIVRVLNFMLPDSTQANVIDPEKYR